jgi:hypothetical protein
MVIPAITRLFATRRGRDPQEVGERRDGMQRILRSWLTFDDSKPVPRRLVWTFTGVVAAFLAASALLVVFAGPLRR